MKFAKLFVFLSLVFSLSCSSDWDQSSQSKDLVINVTAPWLLDRVQMLLPLSMGIILSV